MNYESFETNSNIEYLENGVKLEHFGITEHTDEVESLNELYGTPEIDADVWEAQENAFFSGILCETFVARQLLDRDLSSDDIRDIAEKNGWYKSECGNALADIGNVLEQLGLEVERENNLTVKYLAEMLDNNEKVICAVNSMSLHNPSFDVPSYMRADHIVEVIGLDATDKSDIRIILNDSNDAKSGTEYSIDTFLNSWKSSEFYAVSAKHPEEQCYEQ